MPLSFSSMEELVLDIQKKISWKQANTYLSRNNKNNLKNAGFNCKFKYNEAAKFTGYSL